MSALRLVPARDPIGREALHACPLFAGCEAETLGHVAGLLRARRFRSGEVIFHQDDPGDALHIVADGAVKIVLPSSGDEEPAILATLRAGDFFGSLALLSDRPRSATAIALGATRTLVLRREPFLELVDTDAPLRRALLAALVDEIRRTTLLVQDLYFLDLPGRLARQLVRQAESAPREPDGSVRLEWPYTQAELAGMVGASRQSVNRLLGDLSARGLIALERGLLVIPDPAELERAARR
jgi:CRP/FNR family cyclic AMP-dependent transcriptional regulator